MDTERKLFCGALFRWLKMTKVMEDCLLLPWFSRSLDLEVEASKEHQVL